jgi:hypothetical protein
VEPSCIAEETMTQNINSLPIQEEAKPAKIMQPLYFAMFYTSFYMNTTRIAPSFLTILRLLKEDTPFATGAFLVIFWTNALTFD